MLLEFIELFYWNIRQFSSRVLEKSLKLYFFHIYTWKTAEICKEVKLTTWVMAFQLERIHQPVSPRQFPVKCYYRVLENMVSGPGIVPSKLKQFCKLTAQQYKACQCVYILKLQLIQTPESSATKRNTAAEHFHLMHLLEFSCLLPYCRTFLRHQLKSSVEKRPK